jgi:hypothetical protein
MGKTATYTVNEKVLTKLMMALSPATVSASYDFLTAGTEITRDKNAPQIVAPK